MAVDLGSRTTKAVLVERRGDQLSLSRYALLDAPLFEKRLSPEMLAGHLQKVSEALGHTTKALALTVGLDDAIVRQVEMPQIPVDEMRQVLKNNTKIYLQQDLPNHAFDCYVFAPKSVPGTLPGEPAKPAGTFKFKVLAVAARQSVVGDFQQAAREAGLSLDYLVPGLIGPVNAFEMAMTKVFNGEAVALVDIGFKHTSICILDRGEIALSRVVNIGGDKLTAGLAEAMNISYAEAEGIKVGMAPKGTEEADIVAFQTQLTAFGAQVTPLGRELRASMDFFEHQQDRPITQVFISGGAARSEVFLSILSAEMVAECKTWNPAEFLQLALPAQQTNEMEQVRSQLSVAIGAALAAL